MFNRYFRIALRNFKRQPGYTLLNILGLTLGITASLFILLYISQRKAALIPTMKKRIEYSEFLPI